MKNPLVDPDQNVISSLTSQKSLDDSVDEFSKLLLTLQSTFIKTKQEGVRVVKIFSKKNTLRGGAPKKAPTKSKSRTYLRIEDDDKTLEPEPLATDFSSFFRSNPNIFRSVPSRVISAEPVGRFDRLSIGDYSNRMISNGAEADAFIDDPDNANDFPIPLPRRFDPPDDFNDNWGYLGNSPPSPPSSLSSSSSSSGSSSSSSSRRELWSDADGDDGDDDSDMFNMTSPYVERNPINTLSSLLLEITKQIRNIDLLLISKIKPNVQRLSSNQLNTLSTAYTTLGDIWTNFSFVKLDNINFSLLDYFEDIVPFGNQIIQLLEKEKEKLRVDLLIVVNSYKQNEAIQQPTLLPDSFWNTSTVREMVGAGRTFTGVNTSCRDIPTIWKGPAKDCAYKYML
jgi:hypothetical protein